MTRLILGAVGGFLAWSVLWLVGGQLIRQLSPGSFREDMGTDSAAVLLAILILSIACSLTAGYLAALLAPRQAMAAATALAVVNLAVGLGVQISSWSLLPVWYHLAFLVLLVPGILAGASLRIATLSSAT